MLRLTTVTLATLLFAAAGTLPAEAAPTSSYRMETSTGEPYGDIAPVFLGSDIAEFQATSTTSYGAVVFDADSSSPLRLFYRMAFIPPEGSVLSPGRYDGTGPLYVDRSRPQLDPPFYCQDLSGAFDVLQIERTAAGGVGAFWATFDFTCRDGARFTGEVRVNADVGLLLLAPSRAGAIENRELSLEVATVSDRAELVQLAVRDLPAGARFEDRRDGTGRLVWTPLPSQRGAHTVVFTATDAAGRTDRVITQIDVRVSNDSIDDATKVETLPFSDVLDTGNATSDPADPACMFGWPTAWYTLTVPRRMEILVRLHGGRIGVYLGPAGDPEEVSCGYDPARFIAEPGLVYFIVAVGDGTLLIDEAPPPPPNDDFARATLVTTVPFTDTLDARSATSAEDDPVHWDGAGTVWYSYTPDRPVTVGVDTYDSDYDALTTVYTGGRGHLEFVAQLYGSYRLSLEPGVTYHFLVNGPSSYGENLGGRLVFTITDRPPLSIGVTYDPAIAIGRASRAITIRGETTCSSPATIIVGGSIRWRRIGRHNLSAGNDTVVECTGRTPFAIVVQTYDPSFFGGHFLPGPVTIEVRANGFARGEWADAWVSGPTILRGAP